jgi:hypothetical protein
VAARLREGGGHLLSVPLGVVSPLSLVGVDMWPWRATAGDGSVLVVQGASGASPGGGSCAEAVLSTSLDGAGPGGGRMPSSSHHGPHGGGCGVSRDDSDAVCLAMIVKLIWEVRVRQTPRQWCMALGVTSSPSAEVWHLLKVWWVVDGYGGRVWVVRVACSQRLGSHSVSTMFWLVVLVVAVLGGGPHNPPPRSSSVLLRRSSSG